MSPAKSKRIVTKACRMDTINEKKSQIGLIKVAIFGNYSDLQDLKTGQRIKNPVRVEEKALHNVAKHSKRTFAIRMEYNPESLMHWYSTVMWVNHWNATVASKKYWEHQH